MFVHLLVQIINKKRVILDIAPPFDFCYKTYEGWNFNIGNYLFTTGTK